MDEQKTTADQRSQDKLSPNFTIPAKGQTRTFMPEMPAQSEISNRRTHAFLKDDHPGADYENQIPLGPLHPPKVPPGATNAKLRKQGSR